MNEDANKIQAVINTLQSLNIPATVDNMGKLLGCVQVLDEVKNNLGRKEDQDGNSQAE